MQPPKGQPLEKSAAARPAESPTAAEKTTPEVKMTPEEQMALYEESLKETDWGHQPC